MSLLKCPLVIADFADSNRIGCDMHRRIALSALGVTADCATLADSMIVERATKFYEIGADACSNDRIGIYAADAILRDTGYCNSTNNPNGPMTGVHRCLTATLFLTAAVIGDVSRISNERIKISSTYRDNFVPYEFLHVTWGGRHYLLKLKRDRCFSHRCQKCGTRLPEGDFTASDS